MKIRTFQPGDEAAQVAIYNEAAGGLPGFKPASVQEVQRRTRGRDFDPQTRLFVEADGKVVGYASFQPNGRLSFPWLLKGHESLAEPLLSRVLEDMRTRKICKAFAAYRADWQPVEAFFLQHGFNKARDIVNFVIDIVEMPTPPARPSSSITPLTPADVPALMELMPGLLRISDANSVEQYIFKNPYFTPESFFVLRDRSGKAPLAVGVLVVEQTYAHPKAVDSAMPCFRLGAFGTEGLTTKRINGLFSFLARQDQNVSALGLDLLGHAAYRLRETDDLEALAAQVASDVPALAGFYQRNFRRQGSFPIYEKVLVD